MRKREREREREREGERADVRQQLFFFKFAARRERQDPSIFTLTFSCRGCREEVSVKDAQRNKTSWILRAPSPPPSPFDEGYSEEDR